MHQQEIVHHQRSIHLISAYRFSSRLIVFSLLFRPIENRRFRLASMWPEWNETEINNETWDGGNVKKKETTTVKSRGDTKTNITIVKSVAGSS